MSNASEQARRDAGNGKQPATNLPPKQQAEYDQAYKQTQTSQKK